VVSSQSVRLAAQRIRNRALVIFVAGVMSTLVFFSLIIFAASSTQSARLQLVTAQTTQRASDR